MEETESDRKKCLIKKKRANDIYRPKATDFKNIDVAEYEDASPRKSVEKKAEKKGEPELPVQK